MLLVVAVGAVGEANMLVLELLPMGFAKILGLGLWNRVDEKVEVGAENKLVLLADGDSEKQINHRMLQQTNAKLTYEHSILRHWEWTWRKYWAQLLLLGRQS